MKAFAAVLRLELQEKRVIAGLGLGLAALPWILPIVPGFSALEGIVDAEASAMSLEEVFLATAGEEKGASR